MWRSILHLIVFLFLGFTVIAQEAPVKRITLEECQNLAAKHVPLKDQTGLIDDVLKYRLKDIKVYNYPQAYVAASAWLVSETSNPASAMTTPGISFNPLSKDQYRGGLIVTQRIYDGGIYRVQKKISLARAAEDKEKVQEALFELRGYIEDVYLNILLSEQGIRVYDVQEQEVKRNLKQVESQFQHGGTNKNNVVSLQTALLESKQKTTDLKEEKNKGLAILSELTGEEWGENVELEVPVTEVITDTTLQSHPSYKLYTLERERWEVFRQMANVKSNPKFYFFGNAGVGRPGMDFFNNDFASFYNVGVTLAIPLTGWFSTRQERNMIRARQFLTDSQQDWFVMQSQAKLAGQKKEIQKYRDLVKTDEKIVANRKDIRARAEASMLGGEITSTEYIMELFAETVAMINLEINRINLIKSILKNNQMSGVIKESN